MTIYAAGCVLWREEQGQLKVALVHRGRYDDYGWAKGKLDPGEVLPQTAVREIEEETGLRVNLGVSLVCSTTTCRAVNQKRFTTGPLA